MHAATFAISNGVFVALAVGSLFGYLSMLITITDDREKDKLEERIAELEARVSAMDTRRPQ